MPALSPVDITDNNQVQLLLVLGDIGAQRVVTLLRQGNIAWPHFRCATITSLTLINALFLLEAKALFL